MEEHFRREGFTFAVDIPDALPELPIDEDALIQAVLNLLSNAERYSGEGRYIGLFVRIEHNRLAIRVKDQGLGISAEDLPHIFEKFHRGGDPLTRASGGSGVGLAIVQHIVRAHGGEIEVSSRPGEGSEFALLLPTEEAG